MVSVFLINVITVVEIRSSLGTYRLGSRFSFTPFVTFDMGASGSVSAVRHKAEAVGNRKIDFAQNRRKQKDEALWHIAFAKLAL